MNPYGTFLYIQDGPIVIPPFSGSCNLVAIAILQ